MEAKKVTQNLSKREKGNLWMVNGACRGVELQIIDRPSKFRNISDTLLPLMDRETFVEMVQLMDRRTLNNHSQIIEDRSLQKSPRIFKPKLKWLKAGVYLKCIFLNVQVPC